MSFLRAKHIQYVKDLDSSLTQQSLEYWMLEHLRLNGLYWGVTALSLCQSLDTLPEDEVVSFVLLCFDSRQGGFGAFPKHDAHILSTLSGLQILAIYGRLDDLQEKREHIISYVRGLQLDDGSFQGDSFGEVDTRFIYTGLSSLSILGALTPSVANRAVGFILRCRNFDGGFGMLPGAESHAAQVFTCIGALAIADQLHKLPDSQRTAEWLSDRQVLPLGGLNGRPEKLPDVCYSWWVLSGLAALNKLHWILGADLERFILECQDPERGGISDRPDNQTDVFHTCFGIAGLSLLDAAKYHLEEVDPIYCMSKKITATFTKWETR